jgi:hypothetical protein
MGSCLGRKASLLYFEALYLAETLVLFGLPSKYYNGVLTPAPLQNLFIAQLRLPPICGKDASE